MKSNHPGIPGSMVSFGMFEHHDAVPFLVVVNGTNQGRSFPLDRLPASIGREEADFVPDPTDQRISRKHAKVVSVDRMMLLADEDSTNGTQINGVPISKHVLRDGDRISIGGSILRYVDRISREEQVQSSGVSIHSRDFMTGAFSFNYFKEMLAEAFAEWQLFHTPYGLILIDIDEFKKNTNIIFGRRFGDKVLIELTELVSTMLLEGQEIFRLESDRFGVLARGTSAAFVKATAEMIREAVEDFQFRYDTQITNLSVSIGASYRSHNPIHDAKVNDIFDDAQRNLIIAMESGGNRVVGNSM